MLTDGTTSYPEAAIELSWWIPLAIASVAFGADLIFPIGVAVWLLYLPAVWSCLWVRGRHMAPVIAALSSVLLVAGYFFSPWSLVPYVVAVANRGMAIVVFWISAVLVTRARRNNVALRGSTAMIKAIGNHTPEAIYVKDLTTRLLYANPSAVRMLRSSSPASAADAVLSETSLEILREPERASAMNASDRRVMATGVTESVEETVHADDGVRYLLSTKSALRDERGNITGIVGVSHDITERKRATEELRGHVARQALLLELSSALIAGGENEYSIARTVFGLLREPLQLDMCFNHRLEAGRLRLVAGVGIPSHYEVAVQSLALGEGFCGTVASSKLPIVADEARIASDPLGALLRPMGVRAYVCHPLLAGNGILLGTLSLLSTRRSGFAAEEVAFLQTVCHFVAMAWERLGSDRALRASEEKLQLSLNIGQVGQWSWSAAENRVEWSHQSTLVNDDKPTELGGSLEDLLSRVHAEDRDVLRLVIDNAIASRGDFDCELRFLRADGSVRWARLKGRIDVDVLGRLIRVTGIDIDITEPKSAEAERGHLAAIVDSSTDAIVSKNLAGIVASWNRSAEQLFGYSAAEMIGQSIIKLIPPDRLDEERMILDRIKHGETIQHYETLRVRKDGSTIPVSLSISPVRNARGTIVGGSKIARDITERKQAEEALRHSAKQLEIADKRKDEFLAMLAHELRNPLTPILNASALLGRANAGLSRDGQTQLAMLTRQAKQLTRLVDDLLDISRISQGRIALKEQPLEIGEVIDQAVETVQPLMRDKRHRFIVVKPPMQLFVRGDRARLVQSVGNLLNNAAKYTEAGGEITLALMESNAQVVLEIRDSGAGISAELLPHVFDLFVQNERTLDRSQGGLGVGLSLVKRLIELHGGSVDAQSTGLGRGSVFTIRLPSIAAPIAEHSEVAGPNGTPRRILVVDDNVDVADSLVMLLKLDGHDVHAVYSAADALRAAETLTPEVVILDIGLPEMDGYEVARRLRANKAIGHVRLVAITGYGRAEDRERAEAAGFDYHLVKPADLGALQGMLAH